MTVTGIGEMRDGGADDREAEEMAGMGAPGFLMTNNVSGLQLEKVGLSMHMHDS